MAPSRWVKRIFNLVFKGRSLLYIRGKRYKLVENNVNGACVCRLCGQTIFYFVCWKLFLKCPKPAVPKDQNHSHIFIQITYITGVVYAVVRWGHKNIFNKRV